MGGVLIDDCFDPNCPLFDVRFLSGSVMGLLNKIGYSYSMEPLQTIVRLFGLRSSELGILGLRLEGLEYARYRV